MKKYQLAQLEKNLEKVELKVRLGLVTETLQDKNKIFKDIAEILDFDIFDLVDFYSAQIS